MLRGWGGVAGGGGGGPYHQRLYFLIYRMRILEKLLDEYAKFYNLFWFQMMIVSL